jgi:hypothetical protein
MIIKKVAVMMDSYDSIIRDQRMYHAFVHKASLSVDPKSFSNLSVKPGEINSPFSNHQVLLRLGKMVMDLKVIL